MPARSTIVHLPPEDRAWLVGRLRDGGFSGYLELTDELNERLQARGLELRVSKSSLHRFGQDFEVRIEAFQRTTEMGKIIMREFGDDEGAINDAVIRLVQDRLFGLVMAEGEGLSVKSLGLIAHAVADLARASVVQKRFAQAVRERTSVATERVEQIAKKEGLSDEARDLIRREILGIAPAA